MNFILTDTLDGTMDHTSLFDQLLAVSLPVTSINQTGISFNIEFTSAPTPSEQATCSAVVATHSALPAIQASLVSDIKNHRDNYRLGVSLHAEYPTGSGNLFSCSAASQDNWSKLSMLEYRGLISYPYTVTTYDESKAYDIVDSADLTSLISSIAFVVQSERSLAYAYVAAVLASSDIVAAKNAANPYLDL
jgi:hypothetical protein